MANENEIKIMKGNLKLYVFDCFDFNELKKVCAVICDLGYSCTFLENGAIIFQKEVNEK
jgi:hypothetical protein